MEAYQVEGDVRERTLVTYVREHERPEINQHERRRTRGFSYQSTGIRGM
jgi:hypothetical protein